MVSLADLDSACLSFAGWRSLCPERERAHLPGELASSDAVSAALVEIVTALADSYPENLFCDLDALAAHLGRASPSLCRETGRRIAGLHRLYGRHTAICFRYVHDFVYGFDWARWVAREPITRASVGPFDLPFLSYLERRGAELLELIEGDDAKYPRLRDQKNRSPFPFSREPEAELAVHRALARKGLLPNPAWRSDAQPVWDRPFVALREAEAKALGFWLGPS